MKLYKFKDLLGDTAEEKLTLFCTCQYDIFIQPKYNGVHAVLSRKQFSTRQGKIWTSDNLPAELIPLLHNLPSFSHTFYGELISDSLPFEVFCGKVSVNRKFTTPIPDIQYAIFDMVDANAPSYEQSFSRRLSRMDVFADVYKQPHLTWSPTLKLSPQYTAAERAAKIIEYYDHITSSPAGEGIVIRRNPCLPTNQDDKIPHPDMVKWKRIHEAEGTCIAVMEGKGKRRGMMGSMELRLPSGYCLFVGGGPGLTDDRLTELLSNPPIGKQITFTFEDRTADGMPLRPQFKAIRNYE